MVQDPPEARGKKGAAVSAEPATDAKRRPGVRRGVAPDVKRAVIDQFVGRLLSLQEARARDPDRLKDADAHEALTLASMVFVQLAGWARDHIFGRELKGIPRVAYAKGTVRERELGPDRPWDNETLEKHGAAYRFDDPIANQRIVAALANELQELLGGQLALLISDGFRALQKGEVQPLLEPAHNYHKGPAHTLWRLRFRAVQFVEFQRGCGCHKNKAQDAVAEAYGLGDEISQGGRRTLDGWHQRLPQHFDESEIRDSLDMARAHGGWYAHLKEAESLNERDAYFLKFLDEKYGDAALAACGKEFRAKSPRG